MGMFQRRPKVILKGISKETVARFHMSFKSIMIPITGGLVIYALVVVLFFWQSWHIPKPLQPFATVIIYIPCELLYAIIYYKIRGIEWNK